MEGGLLSRTYFLVGRTTRIGQDSAKAWTRGLLTETFLVGRAARIGQDSAKACGRGLLTEAYFLVGRAARISKDSAKACAREAVRAGTWTTRRGRSLVKLLSPVVSRARLLNPLNWRRRGRTRGLHTETEIGALARRLDIERRRWGQDLHDGIGQVLSGVAFMGRALERKLAVKSRAKDDPGCSQDAAQIAQIAEDAMAQTRSMARVLHPLKLEASGLASALGEMTSDFEKVFGVPCTLEQDAHILIDDDAVATHLYRIAQEAATNAIRHGGAKHVVVALGAPGDKTDQERPGLSGLGRDGRATLTVQDDGAGFAPAEAVAGNPGGRSAKGMGLRIMNYRAKAIGGSLSIRRRPEGGMLLTCEFPTKRKQR